MQQEEIKYELPLVFANKTYWLNYDNTCGGLLLTTEERKTYVYMPQKYQSGRTSLPDMLHRYFMKRALSTNPEYFKPQAFDHHEAGNRDEDLMDQLERLFGTYEYIRFSIMKLEPRNERDSTLKPSRVTLGHILDIQFGFEWRRCEGKEPCFANEALTFVCVN
jgi:hypothetical protein